MTRAGERRSERAEPASFATVTLCTLLLLTVLAVGFVKNRTRVEHMQHQLDRIEREVRANGR